MRKYKLIRTTVAERRRGLRQGTARLEKWAQHGLPPEFVKRSRETAADIVAAHLTGRPFIDVGNLPNIGQIANLPRGTVVETAVRVDRNGFAPIAFGDLPAAVLGLVAPCARVFDMAVDACFARDLRLALQALRLDPVCSHLNGAQVEAMGRRLIKANSRFSPPTLR
jgi:alpha-galactosidase